MATFNLFAPPKKAPTRKNLIEFRAGKMYLNPSNNWVYPDKRKGLVFIQKSSLDGLMHVCWKDRKSGRTEEDLIVFPNETEFIRINECQTGRVYLLKFRNSKKYFFWMQEPKDDRDAELCQKVNDILNAKSSPEASEARSFNLNEFTDLLGELHELGALNDLDIVEIFGSHYSNDDNTPTTTNPFTGNRTQNPSNTEGIREININHITRKMTNGTNSTLEFKLDLKFSQLTLTNLFENDLFLQRFVIDSTSNPSSNTSPADLRNNQLCQEKFELGVTEFLTTLGNEKDAIKSLKDIGLPTNLVKKDDKGVLVDLVAAIDDYYQQSSNKQSENIKDLPPNEE